MAEPVQTNIQYILFAIWLFFSLTMVFQGASKGARFASWRMFTKSPRVFIKLTSQGKKVDIWQHVPHSNLAVGFREALFLIQFLKSIYPDLSGTVSVIEYPLAMRIIVKDGRMVRVRRKRV